VKSVNDRTQHPEKDAVLFTRFLAGDDAAFTELYRRHNQRLFAYCAKILENAEVAQDLTHTLWEKVIGLRNVVGVREEIANPVGFLLRSARNLCLDHKKHHAFQTPLEEVGEHTSDSNELSSEEEIVIAALRTLPEETREILVLHYYSGYSFEEIAEMFGKSSNAIWTRVSRARTQLKAMIETRLLQEKTAVEKHTTTGAPTR
jgi:RNA polymerase sigma-70 factor (ECF subfamily)